MSNQKIKIIAIAGGTASGKTTFASLLAKKFPSGDSLIIDLDSYYKDLSHLAPEERAKNNFDHPDSLDKALFKTHLLNLKKNFPINKPSYDFSKHCRCEASTSITPKKVIIVEGLFALAFEDLNKLYDYKIFVEAKEDIRLKRRTERDIKERDRTKESVLKQYYETVKPMHDLYIDHSKKHADIVINGEKLDSIEFDNILQNIL